MKLSKMMVFRVLKWLALAWAILLLILLFSEAYDTDVKTGTATLATFFVLLAIFFHLEQHKS